jgi:hypothetical protein
VLILSVVVLCVVVWYSAARIVKALENQGRQLAPNGDERTNAGDVVAPGIELQLQLAAIHRVLLDSLKPDWWIKLTKMMEEFEQSPKPEDTGDYHENQYRLIKRESDFAREISGLPLHAVDPTLWACAKQASMEVFWESQVRDLLKTGKGSVTEAEMLLRQCEEADRLHSLSPRAGQHDLIEWFRENVTTSSNQQRGFLELKLRDFIKANTRPKEST